MGTGASAASDGVIDWSLFKGSSDDEIRNMLGQLSDGDRAKLQEALTNVPGAQKATTADEADEDAASAAPYLAEYFKKLRDRTSEVICDASKLMEIRTNPEASKQFKDECTSWYETEAKPLLLKSFAHHDVKKTDVLDQEEAAAFFQHLVQLSKGVSALLVVEAEIRRSVELLEAFEPRQRDALVIQLDQQSKKSIGAAQEAMQAKEAKYLADKATYDAAAFKVVDAAGDGVIRLEEFLAIFEPFNKKNNEIHFALGFLTQEEVEAQQVAADVWGWTVRHCKAAAKAEASK